MYSWRLFEYFFFIIKDEDKTKTLYKKENIYEREHVEVFLTATSDLNDTFFFSVSLFRTS